MQYKVLRNRYGSDLEDVVVGMLNNGWKVVGGVSHSGEAYLQAMIKEDEVPPIKKPSPQKKSRVKAGGTAKTT